MDGGAWWAAVHGVSKSPTRVGHDWTTSLSLFTFMPWRRKWQPTPVFLPGESQGQRSLVGCCLWGRTGSGRVGQDWSDLAAAAATLPGKAPNPSPEGEGPHSMARSIFVEAAQAAKGRECHQASASQWGVSGTVSGRGYFEKRGQPPAEWTSALGE